MSLTTPENPHDLFLSFARDARKRELDGRRIYPIRELKRELEKYRHPKSRERFRVYTDWDDISAIGSRIESAIRVGLQSSPALLVVCSHQASENEWVQLELRSYSEIRPDGRQLAAALDVIPSSAFPEIFDGELGANLMIEDGMRVVEWRRKLKEEAPKIVDAVWEDVKLQDLVDRFRKDQQRRRLTLGAILSLFIVASCFALWFGYASYYENRAQDARAHFERAVSRDDGEQAVALRDLASAIEDAPWGDPSLQTYVAYAAHMMAQEPTVIANLGISKASDVELSPHGKYLVERSRSGDIRIWDLRDWKSSNISEIPLQLFGNESGRSKSQSIHWFPAADCLLLTSAIHDGDSTATNLHRVQLPSGDTQEIIVPGAVNSRSLMAGGHPRALYRKANANDGGARLEPLNEVEWSIQSKACAGSLSVLPGSNHDLAVAVASELEGKSAVRVWQLTHNMEPELLRALEANGVVSSVAWSIGGRFLIALSHTKDSRFLVIWNVESWDIEKQMTMPIQPRMEIFEATQGSIRPRGIMDVSEDADLVIHRESIIGGLAFGIREHGLGIWSVDNQTFQSTRIGGADRITSAEFSDPRGYISVVSRETGSVMTWNPISNTLVCRLFESPPGYLIHSDSNSVLGVSPTGKLVAWPLKGLGEPQKVPGDGSELLRAVFLNQARHIAALTTDGVLQVFDRTTQKRVWQQSINVDSESVSASWLTSSRNGKFLVIAWADNDTRETLWRIEVRRTEDGARALPASLTFDQRLADLQISDSGSTCRLLVGPQNGKCSIHTLEFGDSWEQTSVIHVPVRGVLIGLAADGKSILTHTNQDGLQMRGADGKLIQQDDGENALSTTLGKWQAGIPFSTNASATARSSSRPSPDLKNMLSQSWYVFGSDEVSARIEREALSQISGTPIVGELTLIADGLEFPYRIWHPNRVIAAAFDEDATRLMVITSAGDCYEHFVRPSLGDTSRWIAEIARRAADVAASDSQSSEISDLNLEIKAILEKRSQVSDPIAAYLEQNWWRAEE